MPTMKLPDHWRPDASIARLRARARLLQDIREFFARHNVLEVETPVISMAGNTDPQISSIRTREGGYLRTSPEFALKRLLSAGSGDIYELGRVFRAGESGRSHNPEFTLLEWYRTGFSHHQLMDEVASLIRFCGHGKFDQWHEERLTYQQLFLRHLDIDPLTADEQTLAQVASSHGITDIELNRRQWLDMLISLVIQPQLPRECLTFIHDYPADQAALARVRDSTPVLAERFELYIGPCELANGYQELTDPDELQRRFEAENKQRGKCGQPRIELDTRLLAALRHGMPECAGVALGVDRLLMTLCDVETIADVIAFPSSHA